jgi:hypothetical protein
MAGRFIGENTRLIYDIMSYTEDHDIPGMILAIDFEKAFDSISWSFILQVLDLFNFGPSIKHWISTLYNSPIARVVVNGNMTNTFRPGRGCRQGDPISPYLFLLCVEILGIMIRSNPDIKGIHIGDREHKLSQFADDTSNILDGSEKSLRSTLHTLDKFANISGLTVNVDKTQAIWIGSKRGCRETICPDLDLNWTDTFTLLGVKFNIDLSIMVDENFSSKLRDIQYLLKNWKRRKLTVNGKIIVIKQLIVSKITHLLSSIPSPNSKFLKDINTMFYKFVWNDNQDRIARDTLTQEYNKGGLRMINIFMFNKSLKLSWIKRLVNGSKSGWKSIFNIILGNNLANAFRFGDVYLNTITGNIPNLFWKEVFEYLNDFKIVFKVNVQNCQFQPLWYNNKVKIDKNPVYYKNWANKNVLYINDLLDEYNDILSYKAFCDKFNFKPPFTVFHGLTKAVSKGYKEYLKHSKCLVHPAIPEFLTLLIRQKKGSQHIYRVFIEALQPQKLKFKIKWESVIGEKNESWWSSIFLLPIKTTADTKLRWFQYRLLHRILATNSFLFKIKRADSALCTFCSLQDETLIHIFCECIETKRFWHQLNLRIINETNIVLDMDMEQIIFGFLDSKDKRNLIFILAKFYIYRCRVQKLKLSLLAFLRELKYYYVLDRQMTDPSQQDKFQEQWNIWKNLFLV